MTLDTRRKIVSIDELRRHIARGEWVAVAGLFDPLTVTQARRLAELPRKGRKVLAVVLEDDETLLPAEARAELIAALSAVDVVAIADGVQWRSQLETRGVEIIEDFRAEKQRSAEFVKLILERQQA